MKPGWTPPEKIQDERFAWLMLWLMFIIVVCVMSLVEDIVNYGPMMQMMEIMQNIGVAVGAKGFSVQAWILPVSMMLNAIRILSALMLLYRQKWGLYGIAGVHMAGFLIELFIGQIGIGTFTRLLIVPGVSAWLAWQVWGYLE